MCQNKNHEFDQYTKGGHFCAAHMALTDKERLISELTRSDSFYAFLHGAIGTHRVFLLLADMKGVPIALTRLQNHNAYRLSIKRKNSNIDLKFLDRAVVRAPASKIRGRELESRIERFPSNHIIYFFLDFLSFIFSQFRSKTMCEYILKVRKYRICNGKETNIFYFSILLIRHIAWLHVSSFLSIQDKMLLSI